MARGFVTEHAVELPVAKPEDRNTELDEVFARLREYSPRIRKQSQALERETRISLAQRRARGY